MPPARFRAALSSARARPSEKEILTSRLIDRPIRPLFPEGFLNETQIIAMVLSADPEQDPNSLAIVGAAAALAISDIPFPYVLGGVRVGMKEGAYVANPTYTEGRESKLNIVVAGTEERHRDGGSRARSRSPKRRCWAPSNSATSAARRLPRPFTSW